MLTVYVRSEYAHSTATRVQQTFFGLAAASDGCRNVGSLLVQPPDADGSRNVGSLFVQPPDADGSRNVGLIAVQLPDAAAGPRKSD
jgi:hypothetical protein